jgi:hypothetical protein
MELLELSLWLRSLGYKTVFIFRLYVNCDCVYICDSEENSCFFFTNMFTIRYDKGEGV